MKPVVLVILDGFGYSPDTKYNAIAQAKMPNYNQWLKEYPHTLLHASGAHVGLLPNTIGNSEVGHTTIGAGRVIDQPAKKINLAIEDGSFFDNKKLLQCLDTIKKNNGALHIMGLLSDASVHSNISHLFAFIKAAKNAGIKKIYIHPFLDGRDVPPKSTKKYLAQLDEYLKKIGIGTIATIHGRFYAMDRDNNWERTQKSYDVLTHPHSSPFKTWDQALTHYYEKGITDEFIPPTQLTDQCTLKPNDGIIFINFRPDRARQLTTALTETSFKEFPINNTAASCFLSPVPYAQKSTLSSMWPFERTENTLLDKLHNAGKFVFAIAETEKYAHITYFFSGGREQVYENETRVLIPSIPTKNYVENPEMSAAKITDAVLESLKNNPAGFYLINYANADMVGHSGDIQATIKALEFLDKELGKLYTQIVEKMDGTLYITSDHGNAEQMFDEQSDQPKTAHTINQVPFLMMQKDLKNSGIKLQLKELSGIAPFILEKMNI